MINSSFNGRLTRNPEQRQTQSGAQVVTFTVAVDSTRRDRQGNYLTTFVRTSVWGKRGDFILAHFVKGDPISVAGELFQSNYVDNNGQQRTSFECSASQVEFVPQAPRNRQPQPQQGYQNNAPQAPQSNPNQQMNNYQPQGQNTPQQPNMPNQAYSNHGNNDYSNQARPNNQPASQQNNNTSQQRNSGYNQQQNQGNSQVREDDLPF